MKEDESNKNGGKLILKCNKGYTSIIWEEIILNLLGDNLPKDIYDKINGIIFSSKEYLNVIEISFLQVCQSVCLILELVGFQQLTAVELIIGVVRPGIDH